MSEANPEPRITLDERAGWWLIGSVIANADRAAEVASLDPEDLPQFDQRTWLRAIQRIHSAGRSPDCLAVAEQLAADGTLEDLGGAGESIRLADNAPHIPHFDEWIPVIRRAAARRRLDSETTRIRQMLADPTVCNEEIAVRLADAAKILTVSQPVTFRTLTSAELDAADLSTEYLVEHCVVKGQPGIMAAIRKMLKTSIAIDLMLSLGSGAKFLNQFWIPRPVRVALMSGESGDATIQETARRIAWSKPWKNLSDYTNCVWSFDLPRLGQPQTRQELTRFILDNALEVLIIDPAYLCLDLGEDASNLFSVGKKLRELTDIGHDTGCTMLIIHHCRKNTGDPFAPPELESIAWAGFQEWARQWLLIGRREAYDPDQGGSHRLWLSCGGSAGHSGVWGVDIEEGTRASEGGRRWEVAVDGASKVIAKTIDNRETEKEERARLKEEKTLAADAAKLLTEYLKRPDGDTEKAIRERARLNSTRGPAANDKLLADSLIVPCQVMKNGRSYDGFRPAGQSGHDRDTTGTTISVPVRAQSGTTAPIGGCPGPAHRDLCDSVSEVARGTCPGDQPEWGTA